jgi:hypothetical protein
MPTGPLRLERLSGGFRQKPQQVVTQKQCPEGKLITHKSDEPSPAGASSQV